MKTIYSNGAKGWRCLAGNPKTGLCEGVFFFGKKCPHTRYRRFKGEIDEAKVECNACHASSEWKTCWWGHEKRKKLVIEVARVLASSFYKDMQDPRNRGSKFSEDTFDIERHVSVNAFLHVPFVWTREWDELSKVEARKEWDKQRGR